MDPTKLRDDVTQQIESRDSRLAGQPVNTSSIVINSKYSIENSYECWKMTRIFCLDAQNVGSGENAGTQSAVFQDQEPVVASAGLPGWAIGLIAAAIAALILLALALMLWACCRRRRKMVIREEHVLQTTPPTARAAVPVVATTATPTQYVNTTKYSPTTAHQYPKPSSYVVSEA